MLGHMVITYLVLKETAELFQRSYTILHSLQKCVSYPVSPHAYLNLMLSLSYFSHFDGSFWIFFHVLLFAVHKPFLVKCLFMSSACFKIGLVSYCWIFRVKKIHSRYVSFVRYVFGEYFPQVSRLCFHPL